MKKIETQNNKGFTLLFAILVSALVLSVGASIITLALKQVKLSGSARDSHFAFYAANTGIECALYWDYHIHEDGSMVFRTGIGEEISYSSSDNVVCVENMIMSPSKESDWSYNNGVTTFWIYFEQSGGSEPYCAQVIVTKTIDNGLIDTKIDSRGYNTCDDNNVRRIERGLEINY